MFTPLSFPIRSVHLHLCFYIHVVMYACYSKCTDMLNQLCGFNAFQSSFVQYMNEILSSQLVICLQSFKLSFIISLLHIFLWMRSLLILQPVYINPIYNSVPWLITCHLNYLCDTRFSVAPRFRLLWPTFCRFMLKFWIHRQVLMMFF